MKSVFDKLREELKSVDRWLEGYVERRLTHSELRLANRLKRYVADCRRDPKKWRSESAATSARIKSRDAWFKLFDEQAGRL